MSSTKGPEVPRFADVPSAQGRWRWRRTVLEVSGVWGLGALELHGGGESMRGMNRVGDGVEETVGWDNRRRLCSQSLSPRPDTQSHAHFLFKDDGVSVVSRSGIFKLIRNSRCRVSDQFGNSSLSIFLSIFDGIPHFHRWVLWLINSVVSDLIRTEKVEFSMFCVTAVT